MTSKTYYFYNYIRQMVCVMQAKLTLRLEEQLIENAKLFAKQSGKSLSQMVADYFSQLEKNKLSQEKYLPPITASLKGALQSSSSQDVDEKDYHAYLESKYL